jgi:hypothetical protein
MAYTRVATALATKLGWLEHNVMFAGGLPSNEGNAYVLVPLEELPRPVARRCAAGSDCRTVSPSLRAEIEADDEAEPLPENVRRCPGCLCLYTPGLEVK